MGAAPIEIPQDLDDIFVQAACQTMEFTRSEYVVVEENGPREQLNGITAFIDASNVYGSTEARALALRTLENGKLKTSHDGDLLPYNTGHHDNAGGAEDETLFFAGDIRANEQAGLTAMHTLFVR